MCIATLSPVNLHLQQQRIDSVWLFWVTVCQGQVKKTIYLYIFFSNKSPENVYYKPFYKNRVYIAMDKHTIQRTSLLGTSKSQGCLWKQFTGPAKQGLECFWLFSQELVLYPRFAFLVDRPNESLNRKTRG